MERISIETERLHIGEWMPELAETLCRLRRMRTTDFSCPMRCLKQLKQHKLPSRNGYPTVAPVRECNPARYSKKAAPASAM